MALLSHRRRLAVFVGVLVSLALLATACTSSTSGKGRASSAGSSGGASSASSAAPSSSAASSAPAPVGKPVHVTSLQDDGQIWGIGFAVVLYFSVPPTDSTGFTKAVTVTTNGQPAGGAWFWQKPFADQPVQAVYRPENPWAAHAKIHVDLPLKGVSAGAGLSYDNSLTLDFSTGAAHITTVTDSPLQMVVTEDGKVLKTFKVSLGATKTPTYSGTKVVMQKGEDVAGTNTKKPDGTVHMYGSRADPYSLDVKWATRITVDGEYVHAAPWNVKNLGVQSTSNGCTNLATTDAQWFYNWSLLGDLVIYNTTGDTMPSWDGYGWWNVPWPTWQGGGLLLNH